MRYEHWAKLKTPLRGDFFFLCCPFEDLVALLVSITCLPAYLCETHRHCDLAMLARSSTMCLALFILQVAVPGLQDRARALPPLGSTIISPGQPSSSLFAAPAEHSAGAVQLQLRSHAAAVAPVHACQSAQMLISTRVTPRAMSKKVLPAYMSLVT